MTTEIVDSLLPEIETTEEPTLPDVEVTTDPPADKEPIARAEDGKFKGKEPEEKREAPEAKPEQKVEAKEHTVPVKVYVEERRALKAELDAVRAELASLKNPPKAPPPEPDYVQDPKAYVDHKVQAALQVLEQTKGETTKEVEAAKQTAQQAQEHALQQRFIQDVQQAEAAFVAQQPDYYDAVAHIRQVRVQQLKMFQPDITDQQIVEVIRNEELGMAMQLARSGRNPIATAYELAKAYGYQRKQPQEKLELPKVAGPKTLPPDQTLGSGAGGGGEESEADAGDQFDAAFSEMFKRKSA